MQEIIGSTIIGRRDRQENIGKRIQAREYRQENIGKRICDGPEKY